MIRTIGFLSLLGMSWCKQGWEPCGLPKGCYCSIPILHQIQCTNINVFPFFDELIKPGVISLTIHNSNITGLPPFNMSEWDRLHIVNFIDTPLLSCHTITELQRPGLRIFSECLCAPTPSPPARDECEPSPPHKNNDKWNICFSMLVVLIILFVSTIASILYLLNCYKSSSWTLPVPTAQTEEGERMETWV